MRFVTMERYTVSMGYNIASALNMDAQDAFKIYSLWIRIQVLSLRAIFDYLAIGFKIYNE